MSFQRKRVGAKGIWSGINTPVRQEFSVGYAANGTLYPIASHKKTDKAQSVMAEVLQVLSGYIPEYKTDDFFHLFMFC